MNGTLREIERRIKAFRARTGRNYASVWISPERWALLPQSLRASFLSVEGVPVKVIQVLPPQPEGRI